MLPLLLKKQKGGVIAVLNKSDYDFELNRQRSMTDFYLKIDSDPSTHIQNIIDVVLKEAISLSYISESMAIFLYNDFLKVPILYILPKIHRPGFPPVGHPIIAGCVGLLQPIAQYLDSFLQQFVFKMDSFVKDAKHFIQLTEDMKIGEDCILGNL